MSYGIQVPPWCLRIGMHYRYRKDRNELEQTAYSGFSCRSIYCIRRPMAVTVAAGAPWPAEIPGLQKLIFGSVFPVGLILVVIAGSELFTGNCMIPVISCLNRKAKWSGLFRNWVIVYIGNFIGALFVAYFLAHLTGLFAKDPWNAYIGTIGVAKTSLSWGAAFWRAVGCNWLVCLAVWMALSSEDIAGKILAIWFPIMAFVALGFEHSVANMFSFRLLSSLQVK